MGGAHSAINQLQKEANLDKMQDLLEDMADQEADANEVNQMFQNQAENGMEDAYDDLEAMMAEVGEQEQQEKDDIAM